MWLWACLLAISASSLRLASGESDDSQTEFFLPYSETEDVDFSFSRPGGQGCWMW